MAGIGTSSIGLAPFGIGTPNTSATVPTSLPERARFLNPTTRDYERDPDNGGEYKRMPVTRQRVLLAITETKGSSTARPDDGTARPRKLDDRYPQRMRNAITEALSNVPGLVDGARPAAKLLDVRAERSANNTGRARVVVQYDDLTDNEAEPAPLTF